MIIQKRGVFVYVLFLSVVLSGYVHAGFSANDGVNHVDYLGLKWDVQRDGKKYAVAIADSSSDTFESLAEKVKLDTKDYKAWAHTSDEKPKPCEEYKIPNTVYFHNGARTWRDHVFFTILGTLRMQNRSLAAKDKASKYNVIWRDDVSDSDIERALHDDYVYQYTFTGHGAHSGINTYRSPGVLSGRYTKYGVNMLRLAACGSADKQPLALVNYYKYNDWEWNVATRGWFIGYIGEVHIWNEIFNWRITPGRNR